MIDRSQGGRNYSYKKNGPTTKVGATTKGLKNSAATATTPAHAKNLRNSDKAASKSKSVDKTIQYGMRTSTGNGGMRPVKTDAVKNAQSNYNKFQKTRGKQLAKTK